MKQGFTPKELKTILFSKRANIYYLEKCRVMQKDGRVLYLKEGKKAMEYWNIPIANTTAILLGTGTSITQAAVRLLAQAGVLIGFSGGGGTPLLAGREIEWLCPQSEYRPTRYVQGWLYFWHDPAKRLAGAKNLQRARCNYLEKVWGADRELQDEGFYPDDIVIDSALGEYRKKINRAMNVQELLSAEAHFAKSLYKYAAANTGHDGFVRDTAGTDEANIFFNHGNYLAYGMAASALWVLGIPHGFALMHGKTRRGALVFDVADFIKDILVLPWAFICASHGYTNQEFRTKCLEKFVEHGALDYMYDNIERQSLQWYSGDDIYDGDFYQPERQEGDKDN